MPSIRLILRYRWIIVAVAFSVLALVALVAVAWLDPTKTVSGLLRGDALFRRRTTSYWREVLRAEGSVGRVSEGTIRLFEFESRAEPVLEQCLADPDPHVRWAAIILYRRCLPDYGKQVKAYVLLLDDPDEQVRVAARSLGSLGRESLHAMPKLVRLASANDVTAIAARYALWSIDPEKAIEVEGWSPYRSDHWGFSAEFPGVAKSKTGKNMFTGLDNYTFETPTGGSLFMVAVSLLPPDRPFTVEERYDTSPELIADSVGGSVERNESIEKGGLFGRRQKIVAPDATLESRVFEVGDRVYHAQVVYPQGAMHPEAIEHFLNSFEISWRPESTDQTKPQAIEDDAMND